MKPTTALLLALLATALHAAPVTLFVAPDGDDHAAGTQAQPLATARGARDALRALRAAGRLPEGAVVTFAAGTYYLAEPLVLESMDSGTADGPVVWRSAPGATVVLSGGRLVTGWVRRGERWEAPVEPGTNFGQLYLNGARGQRPRWPLEGYAWGQADVAPTKDMAGRSSDRFEYAEGDLRPEWANRDDLDLLIFHTWTASRLKIAELDTERHVVTLRQPSFNQQWAPIGRGSRYLVENVKELFGQSGNWYLDRPTNTLWVKASPGDGPNGPVAIAPRLEQVLELRGDPDAGAFVWHQRFEGLTFAHTSWLPPAEGHSEAQAESGLPAAILAVGARDVAFDGCRVTQTGGYAFEFGSGCQRDRVERCELTDLGGGGVKMGTDRSDDPQRLAVGMVVRDCLINRAGRVQPGAVGIWLGYGRDCEVSHNEIADLYYSGISMGWSWGYSDTPNANNRIVGNHLHDMPRGVLGDQAGIYTLGVQPGSVISGNLIHDQVGYPWGVGIYLDEGSTGWIVERNVVYNCTTHAFNINYGRDNLVRNNVFGPILNDVEPLLRVGRMEEHRSMTFSRNLVVYDVGRLLSEAFPVANATFDHNLYFNRAGRPIRFGDLDFAAWQATGQDAGSIVADPGFGQAFSGHPPAGSPAERIGFEPFDISTAGRLTPGTPAVVGPLDYPPAGPPPPLPLLVDFEDDAVGAKPGLGYAHDDGDAAPLRVTDEAAASGTHSLRFQDAAGQPHFYNPHYYVEPGWRDGTAEVSFALRLESSAPFEHSWRDAAQNWHDGPSLTWKADGALWAKEQRLLDIPRGQWVRYTLTVPLGELATGRWSLAVTLPDGSVHHFDDLPCSPDFRALLWAGFVSTAEEPAVAYLDDLQLISR